MMDRANEFRDIHSGLSSLKADGWEGRAADHFRSKFDVQIKGWVDAQEAFSEASEAYNSYATTLASAQSQCDGIRSRWKAGRDAVQQAQNNQADARSQAAADGGTPTFDASCDEGPGRSAMAAAVADFQTLVDQVNEAGDLLITALNAGISKLPERTWWDSVKRTVGSILGGAFEAVVELVKLVWKLSGGEGMWDFGRLLTGDITLDEFLIKHVELPIETIVGMGKALWKDPIGFMTAVGKSLIDWDTWTDDPARALGHLLPDAVIALATMGGSAGASAGEKALTGSARALHIGKEVFKAILPINPDDIRALGKLGKNLVSKLTARGLDTASDIADLANTANHLADASRAARAADSVADTLDTVSDTARAADKIADTSRAAHTIDNMADTLDTVSDTARAADKIADTADAASDTARASDKMADTLDTVSDTGRATDNAADTASSTNHAADVAGSNADDVADTAKAGHSSGDGNGSTKATDHSANGMAEDATDSARHSNKTEADKPTSDKSHKEDDTAHHDGDEHPKDTDDKHTTKNDDADSKSTKDKADTHKSDKDSNEHADADPKAKDHSANGKADDAADSARHGDKTEADKPTSDKSHKEDDTAHHDGDEHPKDTEDADSKSPKDEADTHKSDDDNGGGESDNDTVSDKNAEESQEIKSEEGTGEEKRNPHSGDPDHNWGTYVDEDGVPHIDPSDPRPYLNPQNRPALKEQTILDVWNEEVRPDGTVLDPAGRVIEWTPGTPRRGVWDMGHIPGEKYHDRWLEYVNGEMTPAEFREWYNTAEHYRVEHPTTNRSHKYEGLDK